MTRIMQVLWKVLESDPSQDRNVFDALVQTIHPIITNKTDYGYAQEYLERYVENDFKNPNVYDLIIDGFEKMLTIAQEDFQQNHEKIICKYALMSMKLICKIIVKAFINRGSQDLDRFEKLVFSVGHYLQSKDSKENHGFRSFFDIENLDVITLLVKPCTVLDILDATLYQMKETTDSIKYQVVRDLINSNLFEKEPLTLSKIAIELIQNSVRESHSINYVLNPQLKQALIPLIKTLYERTKRYANIERRQDLLDHLVENLLLILIKIAPEGKPEKGSEVEVLLISLMTELNMKSLDKLAEIEDFPGHLQKLFVVLHNQRTSEDTFITELSHGIRINLLHDISLVLGLLSDYLVKLELDGSSYATIEAMFVAISSMVCHKDLMFFNLSVQKRNNYIRKYGDIQLSLCQVLKNVVDALYPEKLYKIIEYNPFDIPLLEAIFTISLDVRTEARDITLNLMLSCLESEFHGTDAESGKKSRNIQLC